MNSNSEKKVSQMILDVAGQFILMVESEEERQTHLDIACAAWNISILPKDKRDKEYKKYFKKMKRLLNDSQLIKYFEEDLNGLIDAKIDLFPNETKQIVSAIIENINSKQYRVTAAFAREDTANMSVKM
ncbi:MAG: hypothetical protein L3J59_04670 [Methylococcaceae bacterium]|nr:hypothetical protein [Methylococcaceae bacterium]